MILLEWGVTYNYVLPSRLMRVGRTTVILIILINFLLILKGQ